MSDIYDKSEIFEEKIAPVIKQLKLECLANKLPMFVTVAVGNDETQTFYKSDMVLSTAHVTLTENRIGKVLLHLNGIDMDAAPQWVRRNISELNEYAARLNADKTDEVNVELTKDMIPEFNEIISGKKPSGGKKEEKIGSKTDRGNKNKRNDNGD